jgi:hypothetical protein
MFKFITDPNIFSYIIMILYILNSIRWGMEGNMGQFMYWVGASILTYSIVFIMGK